LPPLSPYPVVLSRQLHGKERPLLARKADPFLEENSRTVTEPECGMIYCWNAKKRDGRDIPRNSRESKSRN